MPIPQSLQEEIDDINFFPGRQERIEALIAIGDEFVNPTIKEFPRTAESRVPGCESEVFITAKPRSDGTLTYLIAVDNPQGISAMALATMLVRACSGAPKEEINEISEDIVFEIFGNELSMGKTMGLTGMVRMVKHLAK